ncbi:hypothetical protein [Parasediminibacterium sp. JCM 36343]|uniref:hypothetical protein n=1 Tax=Parasediminibacterium sp. JCM 36343 TaxID=3374279 RepID=UPI00397CBAB1
MGAWGTAISSNDTHADIYGEFFDLYNEGLNVAEISKKLIVANQEIIDDSDDCNNFWFALAKAQWECKQLDKDIFDRVKKIIETDADLETWRKLDADEKDIKKRKIVLEKFLADLQTERPKPKSRKKKIIRQPVFEKGDCLTFKLVNGNYSGAVVLEAVKDTEYGYNLIASTRINQPAKPTKKDFENAEVLLLNYASWDNKQNVSWYLPLRHKAVAHLIEKVDNMDVELNYDRNTSMLGGVGDFDIWFIEVANKQFESEQTKEKPTSRKSINEFTRNKSKWKFW